MRFSRVYVLFSFSSSSVWIIFLSWCKRQKYIAQSYKSCYLVVSLYMICLSKSICWYSACTFASGFILWHYTHMYVHILLLSFFFFNTRRVKWWRFKFCVVAFFHNLLRKHLNCVLNTTMNRRYSVPECTM